MRVTVVDGRIRAVASPGMLGGIHPSLRLGRMTLLAQGYLNSGFHQVWS